VKVQTKSGSTIEIDLFSPTFLSMEDRVQVEIKGQERLEFWRLNYVDLKDQLVPLFKVQGNGQYRRCCCRHELNDREPESSTQDIKTNLGKNGYMSDFRSEPCCLEKTAADGWPFPAELVVPGEPAWRSGTSLSGAGR
jgi:hypothetical protein